LSTGDILRKAVADQTEIGKVAKENMDAGKLVPDDIIISMVTDRLRKDDCERRGWLLDGFPRTAAQATALSDAGITADAFIFLDVPDEVLIERVIGRRTDPVTGKIYHMKFSPPPDNDEEIRARLVQRSDDTEEKVRVRLKEFHGNVNAVRTNYSNIMIEVDATSKPEDVFRNIDEAISVRSTRKSEDAQNVPINNASNPRQNVFCGCL